MAEPSEQAYSSMATSEMFEEILDDDEFERCVPVLAPIVEEEQVSSEAGSCPVRRGSASSATCSVQLPEQEADPPSRRNSEATELHLFLMREMSRLSERLDRIEAEVRSNTRGGMEVQLEKLLEAGKKDAEQRRELATVFAKALEEERNARLVETRSLRVALADVAGAASLVAAASCREGAAGPTLDEAQVREKMDALVEEECAKLAPMVKEHLDAIFEEESARLVQVADSAWEKLAESLASLHAKLAEDLTEQSTQATLELVDRHMEAAKALDERASSAMDLFRRLRAEVKSLAAGAAPQGVSSQAFTPPVHVPPGPPLGPGAAGGPLPSEAPDLSKFTTQPGRPPVKARQIAPGTWPISGAGTV